MKSHGICQLTITVCSLLMIVALYVQRATAEQIPLGYAKEYLVLGDARRIDDPIPTFRPSASELQSAVNTEADEVLLTWSLPNGFSPPRYLIAGQAISAEGAPLASTQYYNGVLPGYNSFDFAEHIPRVAYDSASNQYILSSMATRYVVNTNIGPAGRHISPTGEQLTAPFPIEGVGPVYTLQYNPVDNNFLALGYESAARQGYYSSIIDSSGDSHFASNRLDAAPNDPISVGLSAVSHSTVSNKYLTIWSRFAPSRAFEAQFLDSQGNIASGPITLTTASTPPSQGFTKAKVAYNSDADQFLVAYSALDSVRGRLISSAGDILSDELVLSPVPPANPGGLIDFSLVFDETLNLYALATVRNEKFFDLRVFDQTAQLRGHTITVATTKDRMFEVELTSFGEGKFFAAWTTAGSYGWSTDIHGRALRLVPEPAMAYSFAPALGFLALKRRRRLPLAPPGATAACPAVRFQSSFNACHRTQPAPPCGQPQSFRPRVI